jgi:hypothetical protein
VPTPQEQEQFPGVARRIQVAAILEAGDVAAHLLDAGHDAQDPQGGAHQALGGVDGQHADELQRLLGQIERGELTRQEAFERLSELEQRLLRSDSPVLDELRERLRRAGDELGKDKLGKELGQALKQEDLERARKELERLARDALAQKGDRRSADKDALAKALARAAQALATRAPYFLH